MEGFFFEYFSDSIDPVSNEKKSEFHSYISDYNEQDAYDSHTHVFHILNKFFYLRILVCGMSTVWEDTDGCAKCDLLGNLSFH